MSETEQSRLSVESFFDRLSDDYTRTIQRCFPRYPEMLWALLDYLPDDRSPQNILELGCGTGNLSLLLRERFPAAKIRMVDLSADSLAVCQSRFPCSDRLDFQQADFATLDYDKHSFDLVLSSIAIHHLVGEQKRQLFQRIRCWLTPGGVFSYADQHAGVSEDLHRRHMDNWKTLTTQAGSTPQEWQMWMQHQAEHDHHDTLPDQIDWLQAAGFSQVDCVWRYLLWAVLQSRAAASE
jgi:tRNA (cmo5U34)-methyltransferase